jgi:hypothetical protein
MQILANVEIRVADGEWFATIATDALFKFHWSLLVKETGSGDVALIAPAGKDPRVTDPRCS